MQVNQAQDIGVVAGRTWSKTKCALKDIKADNAMDLRKRSLMTKSIQKVRQTVLWEVP